MPDHITMRESPKFTPVHISNDVYRAEVSDIRDVIVQERETWAVSFKITEGINAGKILDGMCSPTLSEKSKLYKWCLALGVVPVLGKTLTKSDLIGKKCRVVTDERHTEKYGAISFVKDVLPQ